jgi:hypothetical protein
MKKVANLPIEDQIKHYKELAAVLPMNKGIPILKKVIELEKLLKDRK